MVKFIRSVLQSFFAILIAFALFCFFGFVVLIGLSMMVQETPEAVPTKGVLVVNLDMEIYDSPDHTNPVQQAIAEIQGEETVAVPLRQVLAALENAKTDDRITGVMIVGTLSRKGSMSNTIAALTELRAKLVEVREAGKKVFAYSHTEGLGELYVKSVADQHWVDAFGMFDYRGVAAQIAYLGGAFERFGIEYQVLRAGKYKSAGEPYVASEMSPETREALGALLDDIWLSLREGIAEGTGLSVEELDTLASKSPLVSADRAAKMGLVDDVIRYDEVLEAMIDFAGYEPEGKTFRQVGLRDYIASLNGPLAGLPGFGGNQVAVVYAEGTIVDGQGDARVVGGDRFARILRQLREDDDVKAIVLRVNSPGGSATASETIAREVELTNAVKPVVVSMGGYAASGGYYISAPAQVIFAQPTTVTGSIGVIGMIPNVAELAQRFEVNFETVETNEHGTLWSPFEARSPEELALIDERLQQTYESFLQRVADGRKLDLDTVREIAQGREWSGVDALSHGLVDRFGGLEDAIARAADLAGIGDDYKVVDLPRAKTLEEVISEAFSGRSRYAAQLAPAVGAIEQHAQPLLEEWSFLQAMSDRYHLYSFAPARISW